MGRVKVVFSSGHELEVEKGIRLSEVIRIAGIEMEFPCGGQSKCGQCKVNISQPNGGTGEQVLACSYLISTDIRVELPEILADSSPVILTSGDSSEIGSGAVDSGIAKHFILSLPESGGSYWDSLKVAAKEMGLTLNADLELIRDAAAVSTLQNQQGLTLICFENEIIAIEAGNTRDLLYGLAVDVGTTTVVGYLMNLVNGEEIGVDAGLNAQRVFGADVISRISKIDDNPENLEKMQGQVIETINHIIKSVTEESGISPSNIYSVTLAGNTCMHHILMGINPARLGVSPYKPMIRQPVTTTAEKLGLRLNPKARVWAFPIIDGFVGGDTTAAVLASNLHRQKGVKLLIDIGTNGELVVNTNGCMAACSTAAGPALEGAHISCGMRAENGAIAGIKFQPELKATIIGNDFARGICGSGLVELTAELVEAGLVNNRGKFVPPDEYTGPGYLRERLVKREKGYSFVVLQKEENMGREIYITQEDISQLQLAKGAIRSAMELIIKKAQVSGLEVQEVLLAGAFGNFLNIEKATKIGLLPTWSVGKVRSVGNAAGLGAKLALLSVRRRLEAEEIYQNTSFLELGGTDDFNKAFIKGMLFGFPEKKVK